MSRKREQRAKSKKRVNRLKIAAEELEGLGLEYKPPIPDEEVGRRLLDPRKLIERRP